MERKRSDTTYSEILGEAGAGGRSREELSFLNLQFASVIDALPDPLYLVDVRNYSILLRNRAAAEQGFEGTSCFAVSHGRTSPCEGRDHECPLEIVKRTRRPCIVEHRHRDSGGIDQEMEIHAYPLFDAAGALAQMVEYSVNVTERKRAVAALGESEERFKSLVNNVNEYVYSVSYRDGQPFNRYDSPKCLAITGYTPEEMRTDKGLWLAIIHEDDRPRLLEYIAAIEAGREAKPILHRIVRKDGSVLWVLNSYTVERDEEGRLRKAEGFILDMDERVAMEGELVAARNAAEAANQAKSDFLASMSHELRTPLNSILGFSQLLAMRESGPLSDRQIGYVQDIKASGEHLLGMIGDILDLSKIEAGKIELEKKTFDLRATILKLVETMSPNAAKKSLKIELDIAPDLGLLEADEVRVRQILYNLLSNAIKFTPEGKRVGLVAKGEGEKAVFGVWDEGIGIAEADRKRVFEPFEQVRHAEGVNLGTGLGLPITARLVALHGGRISLESELGAGSRFTVELGGRRAERRSTLAPAPHREQSREVAENPIDILVVEDNPVNRKLMKAMLESVGRKATFAESGEEAVGIATSRRFDLVFMDINLPGIDGIEAMRMIREAEVADRGRGRRESDRPTTFVALTAHAMKGDAERFIAEGMNEVLTKPIEIGRLGAILSKFANPGIDERQALLLLGGNRELLAEMLDIFASTYEGFMGTLGSLLAQEAYVGAKRLVHGLKGASANIGLSDVRAAAVLLEARLAAPEPVDEGDPAVLALGDSLAIALESIPTADEVGNMGAAEGNEARRSEAFLDTALPLSQAVEHSPITTVITDLEGKIEYVNAAFVNSTGYTKQEAIGQNPRIISSGEQPKSVYKEMWETIGSGSTWKGLFHNRKKNGDLYWEEATISPVRDPAGKIAHFLALKQDVTERKLMEERLRLQATAMDSTLGFIVIADARARDLPVIYANAAYFRVTGYSPEEVIGRNPRYLHEKEPRQPGLEEIRAGLRESRPCQALLRNYRKDGSPFWNEIYISPIRDERGEVTHYVGISNDVTNLVAIRNELFENERRLRISQELANIGTWDWNIQTGRVQGSERIGPLFGLGEVGSEISYETLLSSVHAEDRPLVEKAITACLVTGDSFQVEHRVNLPDGRTRWLLENGNVTRDEGGKPVHLLGIVQDLTDRKLTELEIVRSREEAVRANKVKSEFLSSMSHELRTPMNAILGFGQLLERDQGLDESQLDFIGEIMKAGRHLLDLINEVLDLSKIEAGKIELAPEPVACAELIEEAIGLVAPLAARHNITISKITEALPTVIADRLRLKQALVNLLSNAIKYNRDGGTVELRLSIAEDRARLEVVDSGYGIPDARMAELFSPFSRLGRDGGDIEGSGIGLHISKRLVELMGGGIGASSSEGKGSTFWIELPLVEARKSGAAPLAQAAPRMPTLSGRARQGTCSTVLYLEDNPANLRLVSQILATREDIYLLTAPSPSLGLELAEAHDPDLILLDLDMPEMDGYEVLRRLRSKDPSGATPIVALTALAMPAEIAKGMAAGFDDYITKPLDVQRFLEVVDSLLEKSRS